MKVVVVSLFRNATRYLERYFEQMADFQRLLNQRGDSLTLILGYGDSGDGTGPALYDECSSRFDAHLFDVSHGGHDFGSVVHPIRFRQLAGAANKLWAHLPRDADYIAIVESDLIWSGDTLMSLLDGVVGLKSIRSDHHGATLLAPMVIDSEGYFYDVWAFRKNGIKFDQIPPFFTLTGDGRYQELDSVGSCVFMDAGIAYKLSWLEEEVIVSLCKDARRFGARVFVDTQMVVRHPDVRGR